MKQIDVRQRSIDKLYYYRIILNTDIEAQINSGGLLFLYDQFPVGVVYDLMIDAS